MRIKETLLIVLWLWTSALHGNVSPRNGNFFIGYSDLVLADGALKIERVYNSKTGFKGMFGWGWGSEMEVHMTAAGDGSLVVHEYGGGAENLFLPESGASLTMEVAVSTILDAGLRNHRLDSAVELDHTGRNIREDVAARRDFMTELADQKAIVLPPVWPGATWRSAGGLNQRVFALPEGAVRRYGSGKQEIFRNGKLVRVVEATGYSYSLSYAGRLLRRVADAAGNSMEFGYNDRGLVDRIAASGGKSSEYRYDDRDQLIESRDAANNRYRFEYDERHNMTAIRYTDGTSMEMGYFGRDRNESIHSVKERDGRWTEYEYQADATGLKRTIVETSFDAQGVQSSQMARTYEMGVSPEGYDYRAGYRWSSDKSNGEIAYDPVTKGPTHAAFDGRDLRFTIDEQGRLQSVEEGENRWRRQYDAATGNLAGVFQENRENGSPGASIEFHYDGDGRLETLQSSEGTRFRLTHTRFSELESIEEKGGARVEFAWNRAGRIVGLKSRGPDETNTQVTIASNAAGSVQKVKPEAEEQAVLRAAELVLRLAQTAHRGDLPPFTGCRQTGCDDPNCSRGILSDEFYNLAQFLANLGAGPRFEDLRKRAELPKD